MSSVYSFCVGSDLPLAGSLGDLMLGHHPQIVGDHAPADPALHPIIAVIATAVQPMTPFQSALTILQTGPLLLCGFLGMVLGAARKKIAAAIERRRVRSALGKLDDYMLKDIGIARSDIERIARRPYPPRW